MDFLGSVNYSIIDSFLEGKGKHTLRFDEVRERIIRNITLRIIRY